MNSFETDLSRAIFSRNFLAALFAAGAVLSHAGIESELFSISVPVLASLPYSTAWLVDYQNGFIKEYLPRCGKTPYILGKFLSCGISGGTLFAAALFFAYWQGEEEALAGNPLLLFLSGMFWAVTAATLAAASNSRYVAYGGAFVLFYALVILYQRYFTSWYCLYPVEWYSPKHTWVFGNTGIILMLGGLILIMYIFYHEVLRRCMEGV